MVQRLLAVENAEEPTEIVIHVNMLKEGCDVTNLYTIVPLRAANARILIEQSIGRGLRLPYGKRAGIAAVDRLSIVAHDKFQEIIDEANRPNSPIRLQQVILDPTQDLQRMVTVVSQSNIEAQIAPSTPPLAAGPAPSTPPPIFTTEVERKIAQVAYDVIRQHESLPRSSYLLQDDVQQSVVREVEEALAPVQLELAGVTEKLDIAEIVHKTSQLVVQQSIDIPAFSSCRRARSAAVFNRFPWILRESTINPWTGTCSSSICARTNRKP
jgi:type III restriction enzyme